jgi:hypothetical protein
MDYTPNDIPQLIWMLNRISPERLEEINKKYADERCDVEKRYQCDAAEVKIRYMKNLIEAIDGYLSP